MYSYWVGPVFVARAQSYMAAGKGQVAMKSGEVWAGIFTHHNPGLPPDLDVPVFGQDYVVPIGRARRVDGK